MSALPDSVRWYATLLIITWAFAPLVRLLCGRLPDRGAAFAKPLGLLATVWPVWFLASVSPIPYSTALLWGTVALAAAVGWGFVLTRRLVTRDWLGALAVAELVTLVAFVAFVGLRGYTPDIAGTEKPMDSAFLSSTARVTEMPPADPWMAGETINYYYLGYLLHGSLARMADVPAWVGFNLALAATFAMTVTAAAGLGYAVARTRLDRGAALGAGALAAFAIAIAGNLHAPLEVLRDPRATWDAFWWQGIGWESSRVVIDTGSPQEETINEFPSFSFILGDLHPHVTALPFTLVALGLALTLFLRRDGWGDRGRDLAAVAIVGAVIGALYPMNSWDYPTYLGIAVLALLAVERSRATVVRIGVLLVASIAAWAPFWVTFVPFAGGDEEDLPGAIAGLPLLPRLLTTVATYGGEHTSAGEFLTVFGVPWAIAVLYLGFEFVRAFGGDERPTLPRPAVVAAVIVAIVALLLPAPVILLAGAPLAASLWLLGRAMASDSPIRTVVAALFAVAFALILLTEFFYIQDPFDGRFNTLFKVYYQVWTLVGVAGALALVLLWRAARSTPVGRIALASGVAVMLLLGITYPIVSAKGWTEWAGPRDWQGLDGAAYIGDLAADDLAAIRWLAENARDGDVVLEAPGCSYAVNGGVPTGRLSAYTGVPTLIGWLGSHERFWRGGQPALLQELDQRQSVVETIYGDPTDSELLSRYGVTLLYVGSFERFGAGDACEVAGPFEAVADTGYPGAGWTEVYSSGEARIYRRTD